MQVYLRKYQNLKEMQTVKFRSFEQKQLHSLYEELESRLELTISWVVDIVLSSTEKYSEEELGTNS